MNYKDALDALEKMIEEARGVPLSASAVIPREEALQLVRDLKQSIPAEHEQAQQIVNERERVLTEAHEKGAFIIEQAREERQQMLSRAEVVQAANQEAQRVTLEAQTAADSLATQADDYVDAKLANFEIIINKALRTISRGREQLQRKLDAAAEQVQPLELDDSGEISGSLEVFDGNS